MNIILEIETADPDDILMLIFALNNPLITLNSVVITPGSKEQVNLVGHILKLCNQSQIPIGSYNIDHPKKCVSGFYYKIFDNIQNYDKEIYVGWQLIEKTLKSDTTIITGSPLKNLGEFIKNSNMTINKWVCQGGFVSDSMIPKECKKLDKFNGPEWCNTYNFNGAPQYALSLIETNKIKDKKFVSKNICHQMAYTKTHFQNDQNNDLIKNIMAIYLEKKDEKKNT